MKKTTYATLAQRLNAKQIIDLEKINGALNISRRIGRPFVSVLFSEMQRHSSESELTLVKQAIAEALEIPFFDDADDCIINTDMTRRIGFDDIERKKAFVVIHDGESFLHVYDPMDYETNQKILAAIGTSSLEYCMMSPLAVSTIYTRDVAPLLISDRAKTMDVSAEQPVESDGEEEVTDVAKMFNDIVNAGISLRASDIHLCPEKGNAVIRVRVDGVLRDYMPIPLSALSKLTNFVVSQAKIPEPEQAKTPRDGSMEFKASPSLTIPLRVSLIEDTDGREDICVRILNSQKMTLSELGMYDEDIEKVRRLFRMTKGIVLFVGPTGSGKSTSMYAGLRETDYKHRRVMTVEDPVEQHMDGILQVSVNDDAGLTFESAITAFLRHDPDIICVGEIRRRDVGASAMRAAETGHLVISTLHSNDAPSAITRLTGVDIAISHQDVASSLSAVVAQRLARRVCPNCKEEYDLPTGHHWRTEFELGDGEIRLARGKGCPLCNGIGYKGRIVLTELLICNRQIRSAIERSAPSEEIEKLAAESGYKPLIYDGIRKALDGLTTFDELEPIRNDII